VEVQAGAGDKGLGTAVLVLGLESDQLSLSACYFDNFSYTVWLDLCPIQDLETLLTQ
jgi:hypothetical protein